MSPSATQDVLHAAVVGSSRGQVTVDVHRGGRKRFELPDASLISIGEKIVEQNATPVVDSFRSQQAVIDQTHNRRATDTKEIGSLLGG